MTQHGESKASALQSLTPKEAETLRLLVRGYDSKSIARHFQLSVHTVNERLRNARQKLAVSSSREAARLLFESENAAPENCPENMGDTNLGDDLTPAPAIGQPAPNTGHGRRMSPVLLLGVVAIMPVIATIIALAAATPGAGTAEQPSHKTGAEAAQENQVVQSARQWLALLDAQDWTASWKATGQAFRDLNSLETWTKVVGETQPTFGPVQSRAMEQVEHRGGDGPMSATGGRTLVSQDFVPAPPMGYEMVKFQTRFANKPDAVETLTLVKEGGAWKVVGYWVD